MNNINYNQDYNIYNKNNDRFIIKIMIDLMLHNQLEVLSIGFVFLQSIDLISHIYYIIRVIDEDVGDI